MNITRYNAPAMYRHALVLYAKVQTANDYTRINLPNDNINPVYRRATDKTGSAFIMKPVFFGHGYFYFSWSKLDISLSSHTLRSCKPGQAIQFRGIGLLWEMKELPTRISGEKIWYVFFSLGESCPTAYWYKQCGFILTRTI